MMTTYADNLIPPRKQDIPRIQELERQVAELTAKLAATEGALDAYGRDNADLTRRLEEAQRSYDALSATRDALQAKLAAAEQERDALRTALLALPVVVKELEQALDVLDGYYDGADDSNIKWLGEPMYYVQNAKERLAQARRQA